LIWRIRGVNKPNSSEYTHAWLELDSPNELNVELELGPRAEIYARARHAEGSLLFIIFKSLVRSLLLHCTGLPGEASRLRPLL
jgi:hypothetical protein